MARWMGRETLGQHLDFQDYGCEGPSPLAARGQPTPEPLVWYSPEDYPWGGSIYERMVQWHEVRPAVQPHIRGETVPSGEPRLQHGMHGKRRPWREQQSPDEGDSGEG